MPKTYDVSFLKIKIFNPKDASQKGEEIQGAFPIHRKEERKEGGYTMYICIYMYASF